MTSKSNGAPDIWEISRRDFLAVAAAAAGGVLAPSALGGAAADATAPGRRARIKLPDVPSQNPAYLVRESSEQGLIIWTQLPDREFRAYRVNRRGRQVWELCDGVRTPDVIAAEYARVARRPAAEAVAFLDRLKTFGVVVAGAHIVAEGPFPRPPHGGCYHRRVGAEKPKAT